MIAEDHHRADGGVEAQALDVLAHLLDGAVHELRGLELHGARIELPRGDGVHAIEEASNTVQARGLPGFHLF
jgi:hypothetical protein